MESSPLLHPDVFSRMPIVGQQYEHILRHRSQETSAAIEGAHDPDVTVLVRTRNNETRMQSVFDDIAAQYFGGEVQVVVVDTESSDKTVAIAEDNGATVVNMRQHDFTYPRSMNLGFEAADHPYVVTLTNRTNLVSNIALKAITRWHKTESFAGVYGAMVWDQEASTWESLLAVVLNAHGQRLAPAAPLSEWEGGALVGHRSAVSKRAWEDAGGYDERFERGGEDMDLARRLIAMGGVVVRDPALSVHHSHGYMDLKSTLRYIREVKQFRVGEPHPFEHEYIRATRSDMHEKSTVAPA